MRAKCAGRGGLSAILSEPDRSTKFEFSLDSRAQQRGPLTPPSPRARGEGVVSARNDDRLPHIDAGVICAA